MQAARLLTMLTLAAALTLAAGCGDDPDIDHGLESRTLSSHPHGDAVEVRYACEDGEAWVADLAWQVYYYERVNRGDRKKEKARQGSARFELRQDFARSQSAGAPTSHIVFRCLEAEGDYPKTFLERAPMAADLEHAATGRPLPGRLTFRGGTPQEQKETLDLLISLLLAGLGGSPPWVPARPVREGEAWSVHEFVHPRTLANIRREARRFDATAPEPTVTGTIRLEKIRDDGGERLLELQIDALIELTGPLGHGATRGRMASGDRIQGRAVVSARTGLPVSMEVSHEHRLETRSPGETVHQKYTVELRGSVRRAPAPGGG